MAADGSEDGGIHCVKLGKLAADAAPEIARLTSVVEF